MKSLLKREWPWIFVGFCIGAVVYAALLIFVI